jgi:hypothetical protein
LSNGNHILIEHAAGTSEKPVRVIPMADTAQAAISQHIAGKTRRYEFYADAQCADFL